MRSDSRRDAGMTALRLLASPCRSGSTAVLNSFAQNKSVTAVYQAIKSGLRSGIGPDYRLFRRGSAEGGTGSEIIIDKETFGPHTVEEASFELFPDASSVCQVRPAFLFRNPVDTWGSWQAQGWAHLPVFLRAYRHCYDQLRRARSIAASSVVVITYDALVEQPRRVLELLCSHWGVSFTDDMLRWSSRMEPNVSVHGAEDFAKSMEEGSFDRVLNTATIERSVTIYDVSPVERDTLRNFGLDAVYRDIEQLSALGFMGRSTASPVTFEIPNGGLS